ncbi:MAG: hypothetical protein V4529_17045 [Gemmatimonadota bacterium]
MDEKKAEYVKAYVEGRPLPPSDPPPARAPLRSVDLSTGHPWYRRAWTWLSDAHTFLGKFAAICAVTVGAHAYVKGLVTTENLKHEVKAALDEAIEERRVTKAQTETRLHDLEARAEYYAKQSDMTALITRQTAVEQTSQRTSSLVDGFIMRSHAR